MSGSLPIDFDHHRRPLGIGQLIKDIFTNDIHMTMHKTLDKQQQAYHTQVREIGSATRLILTD